MPEIFYVGTDAPDAPDLGRILAHDSYNIVRVDAFDFDAGWHKSPDLVIFDAAVSRYSPPDTCRHLRALRFFKVVPILLLVDACGAEEIAEVLDAGCDDCLWRSVREQELAARVRALLRRRNRVRTPALVLDAQVKTAEIYGKLVGLTPTEYNLLETLCKNPGQHITTSNLLQTVWKYPTGMGDPALVRNHIRNLRRKLETDPERPRILSCVQGRGYMIAVDVFLR